MKTFVIDVPKELITGRYRDAQGGLCAMGVLYTAEFGSSNGSGVSPHFGGLDPVSCKLRLRKMGVPFGWTGETVYQNDQLTNPASRVKNLKRRLRALQSYGHVEFLFLDEMPGVVEKQNLHELVLISI